LAIGGRIRSRPRSRLAASGRALLLLVLPVLPIGGAAAAAQTLGGDLGGLRPALATAGLELGIGYTGEGLGDVSGGIRRGAVYEGKLTISLDADLAKLAGWKGATAHIGAIAVHGRGPSGALLGGNLMDVSNIEAHPSLRLYTLWLAQSLFEDRLSIRLGQLGADEDFIISDTGSRLINATFGWPILASANMTEGAPVYPLPTPGIRLQLKPSSDLTMLAAAFSAKPGGQGCLGNPQICNPSGTAFSFSGGTLLMSELQYALAGGHSPTGLPGTYRLGGWRETGSFPDQLTGRRDKKGDWGLYAVADQTLWQGGRAKAESLSAFLRVGAAPPDRNLVSWYVDGGLGWKGAVPGRSDDVLTLGAAYGGISGDAAAADRAARPPLPVRDYEAVVELDYQAQIRPGWTLQPDLQYVMHPGGNIANPAGRGAIPDALVLGLRTALAF
jgi:porin